MTLSNPAVSLWPSRLEIPFGDCGSITYAEQTGLSSDNAPIAKVLVRLVDPDKSINASIFTAWNDELLVPRAIRRVPDFDVAVSSSNSESRKISLYCRARRGV